MPTIFAAPPFAARDATANYAACAWMWLFMFYNWAALIGSWVPPFPPAFVIAFRFLFR